MTFPKVFSVSEIAELIQAKVVGDPSIPVKGINEIHRVKENEIVFVDHPKYYEKALNSKASIILIDKEVVCPDGKALLVSENPFRDFNFLISYFEKFESQQVFIHPSAKIGNNTIIQPGVFIGRNVTIGDYCLIHANVTIQANTKIGNRVEIHSGTVIGTDAFYYKKINGSYEKLISVGGVIIEDDVEIGANCTIDRGVTDNTIIKRGSKLDNLIQIGHEVVIGENCLIASQVGIAGCCVIGNNVTIWGQVGLKASLEVGDGVTILAQSGITKNLESGKTYFGSPADEARLAMKKLAAINKII